jgi:hypothetical protein
VEALVTALEIFVALAMNVLAPDHDHREMAATIADVVESEPPLFKDDRRRLKTAALVVAVAFRESTFRNDAMSETGDACAMQIHRRPDLADDLEGCIRVGLEMLRESMRMCPAHPIAFFASGPRGCSNARAQRISRDRMALARSLLVGVSP